MSPATLAADASMSCSGPAVPRRRATHPAGYLTEEGPSRPAVELPERVQLCDPLLGERRFCQLQLGRIADPEQVPQDPGDGVDAGVQLLVRRWPPGAIDRRSAYSARGTDTAPFERVFVDIPVRANLRHRHHLRAGAPGLQRCRGRGRLRCRLAHRSPSTRYVLKRSCRGDPSTICSTKTAPVNSETPPASHSGRRDSNRRSPP
jgi:hypothetical protein